MEEEKKEIGKENKDFLEILIEDSLHRVMGKSLDTMRISGMTDRSLAQATRTMKDTTNELITYVIKVLKEKGYIKEE